MTGRSVSLEPKVDRAREAFLEARLALTQSVALAFADVSEGGDALMAFADEFGPARAAAAFDNNPALFGPLLTDRPEVPGLASLLEAVIEAQDVLDQRLSEGDFVRTTADPAALRRIHINGRLFAVDPSRSELRAIDDPDVRLEFREPNLEPSMVREVARQRDIDRLDRLKPRAQEPER